MSPGLRVRRQEAGWLPSPAGLSAKDTALHLVGLHPSVPAELLFSLWGPSQMPLCWKAFYQTGLLEGRAKS